MTTDIVFRISADDQMSAAIDRVRKNLTSLDEYARRTVEGGATRSINAYVEANARIGDSTAGSISRAIKGTEDQLTNLLVNGKFSTKALVDSMLSDFTRLAVVRPLLSSTLGNLFGGSISASLQGPSSDSGDGGFFGSLFGSITKLIPSIFGSSTANTTALPSFDVGTTYVPRDMVAQIHRGERIIPAAQNSAGASGNGGRTFSTTIIVQGGGDKAEITSHVNRALDARDRAWAEHLRQLGLL